VTALRSLVVLPVRLYRRLVSPVLPKRCKYHPSCSEYAVEAVRSYGVLRGVVLAGWRLLRCNPWSHGGFDPVERQSLFKPRGAAGGGERTTEATPEDKIQELTPAA
jgi:putative membrane protein insertion efficiency factor